MNDTNIWREIQYIKNPNRKAYFQWKNKIQNIKRDYGALSEEEFLEYIGGKGEFMNYMKRWESSPEYKRLVFLLKEDSFATDLLETYNKVKELALTGDSQAIKNMIMLQKEIKKYRQDIDSFNAIEEEKEEDDGLEI
ncbi:hypothetical protein [Alkaliphilus sp. B6464]|uniref:hypothetical protein n=1 Tax=Alkaliphilus sp. B6464 TaxID=2731219 RepID=UPI001BA5F276|nr:hypothetical protein [Alkaliphilus sp. B6464]QUH20221.1 hypothetical protein HYG84_10080 [Alkaliphilus sp. B6464]